MPDINRLTELGQKVIETITVDGIVEIQFAKETEPPPEPPPECPETPEQYCFTHHLDCGFCSLDWCLENNQCPDPLFLDCEIGSGQCWWNLVDVECEQSETEGLYDCRCIFNYSGNDCEPY